MFAIREKLWPAVTALGMVLIELSRYYRCAPIRRDAIKRVVRTRREKDDAVATPAAPTR